MTDELEGLDAKLLRGMLPALYKKAQEGDQRSIDTVLRILQRLEKNAPTQGVKSVNFVAFVIENPIPQRSKECKIGYIAVCDYAIIEG